MQLWEVCLGIASILAIATGTLMLRSVERSSWRVVSEPLTRIIGEDIGPSPKLLLDEGRPRPRNLWRRKRRVRVFVPALAASRLSVAEGTEPRDAGGLWIEVELAAEDLDRLRDGLRMYAVEFASTAKGTDRLVANSLLEQINSYVESPPSDEAVTTEVVDVASQQAQVLRSRLPKLSADKG